MKLSVLVPTVSPRERLLSRLLWSVTHQSGDFEVVVHPGDEIPMGDKLNRMFVEASGEYVVCVDDDDMLADSYMESVLPQLGNVDFLGYRILVLASGQYWMEVTHRGDVAAWGKTERGVSPKCPIRREIAVRVPFGNEYNDDEQWSSEAGRLVTSAGYVNRALYVYDWWPPHMLGTKPSDFADRWDDQRDVGMWPFDSTRVRRL